MKSMTNKQKVIVVGAGPVGALAALYAAKRGDDVHVYELRGGMSTYFSIKHLHSSFKIKMRHFIKPQISCIIIQNNKYYCVYPSNPFT